MKVRVFLASAGLFCWPRSWTMRTWTEASMSLFEVVLAASILSLAMLGVLASMGPRL